MIGPSAAAVASGHFASVSAAAASRAEATKSSSAVFASLFRSSRPAEVDVDKNLFIRTSTMLYTLNRYVRVARVHAGSHAARRS